MSPYLMYAAVFVVGVVVGRMTKRSQEPGPVLPAAPRPPLSSDVESTVRGLLAAGKKIEAIKMYREATGCGLKEAKDFVEAM